MKNFFSIFTIFTAVIVFTSCDNSNNSNQKTAFFRATQALVDSANSPSNLPASQVVALKGGLVIPVSQRFDAHAALAEDGDPDFWHSNQFIDEVYEKMSVTSPMDAQNISVYELTKSASIATVVAATHAEPMTLDQFATTLVYLVAKQPNGQDGVLKTDVWNIFYVETSPGKSVAVDVYWYSDYSEWGLGADPLTRGWDSGRQVFLRNGSGT